MSENEKPAPPVSEPAPEREPDEECGLLLLGRPCGARIEQKWIDEDEQKLYRCARGHVELSENLVPASKPAPGAVLSPFDKTGADRLADEVAVLIENRVIDARSPAADALLDYREPPSTPRSDELAAQRAALETAREALREAPHVPSCHTLVSHEGTRCCREAVTGDPCRGCDCGHDAALARNGGEQ